MMWVLDLILAAANAALTAALIFICVPRDALPGAPGNLVDDPAERMLGMAILLLTALSAVRLGTSGLGLLGVFQ